MKKNTILKALGIMFLLFIVLSWIIPTGYFSNGGYVKDVISPVGIFDIILYPLILVTSSLFVLTFINFILIGAFYGILNKTHAYPKLLDNMSKKLKGRETLILILTTIFFTIMSSITGLEFSLFILVPFCGTLLLLIGYNKITTMLATVGGILVGNMASTYGVGVAGYVRYLTENINLNIIFRIILLIISTIILIIFTIKKSKNKETRKDIMLYKKTTKKANTTPLVIILVLTFIFVIVGMYDWTNILGIKLFDNIHSAVTGFKINEYPLFDNLIGSMPAIGAWSHYELGLTLVIMSFITGLVYKLKFSEMIEGAKDGIKEILPVALIALAANILLLLMNVDSNGYTFYNTIINQIIGGKFAIVPFSFATAIGSLLYNDFSYLLSSLYGAFVNMNDKYATIGFITQTIHGLVQLIAPTSVFLVAGLTYFKVPYTKWLKEVWKLILCLLVIVIILLIFI